MDLTPWTRTVTPRLRNPFRSDLISFQQEVDDLMDSFFDRRRSMMPLMEDINFSPAVDVYEDNDKYLLEAELPGMNEDDISVDLNNNTITIKGEKKFDKKEKGKDYVRAERAYGSFRRDITFPQKVEADNVSAKLKDGILKVECAKEEKGALSHKTIPIRH